MYASYISGELITEKEWYSNKPWGVEVTLQIFLDLVLGGA
jgi:hypothetical protein